MGGVRRSILFSAIDRYVAQILVVGTTAVMARILTPAETGLYVIANVFILLADNFRLFGVGVYIVQERELSRRTIQSAFTVTLVISLAMSLAIFLSAGEIAFFYGAPELKKLLTLAALGFLIVPFGSPIIALLQRDMAFNTLAALNIATALTNAGVTVALGWAGFGPLSYVWGYVVSSTVLAALAFAARPERWIFRPSFAGLRPLMSFGAMSSFVTVVGMAYDLLPRLIFGKMLGLGAVGLYSRAVAVSQLPDRAVVSALQPVVLPAMAARTRAGGHLKESYLRGHALMSAIQWPMLIMLALLANPVVRILLGPQWGAVPPLVRLIALATMALAPAFMTFPVLVSVGRIRDVLLSSLLSLPPSILIMIGAATLGLKVVAASLLVVAPLQMLVALIFVRRAIDMSWAELAGASRASIVLALGTALLPGAVVIVSPTGFALGWLQALTAAIGGASGWLTTLWLLDHPLKAEIHAMLNSLTGGHRVLPSLRSQ